jgi:hypothetical protein
MPAAAPTTSTTSTESVEITDGSSAKDEKLLGKIVGTITTLLTQAVELGRKATEVHYGLAVAYASARSIIRDAKGLPVWNQTAYTDEYRATVGKAEDAAFASLADSDGKLTDEGKRIVSGIKNAARQMMGRNGILEAAIVAYVLDEVTPDVKVTKWTEETERHPSVPAAPKEHPAFARAVLAEYRRTGMNLPVKYGGPVKGKTDKQAGPEGEPSSVSASLNTAVEALAAGTLSPLFVAANLNRLATLVADTMGKVKPEAYAGKRAAVASHLNRASDELRYAAKVADGKATVKDNDARKAARFTKDETDELVKLTQ